MQKWEYIHLVRNLTYEYVNYPKTNDKKIKWIWGDDANNAMDLSERLNYLGELGWELVATYPTSLHIGDATAGLTDQVILILKRPKP